MVRKVSKCNSMPARMEPEQSPSMEIGKTILPIENGIKNNNGSIGNKRLSSIIKICRSVSLDITHSRRSSNASQEINSEYVFLRELRQSKRDSYVAPRCRLSEHSLSRLSMHSSCTTAGTKSSFFLKASHHDSILEEDEVIQEEKQENKPRVTFVSVNVQLYPIILDDDGVGGTGGPPLTISWDSISSYSMDFDVFEASREGVRRTNHEMRLPKEQRTKMLLDLDFTIRQINEGTKRAAIARRKRRSTNANLQYNRLHEIMEDAGRITKFVFTLGIQKRREKKYLKKWTAQKAVEKQ